MKTPVLFQNWQATIKIAFLLAAALVLSLASNAFLSFKLMRSMERLVLIPGGATETMSVGRDSASRAYLEAWAIYITNMLGAVTPSNAQSIADFLGKHIDQPIWHAVRAQILSVVEDPQYNRQNAFNMFVAKRVLYEPDSKKTFVEGSLSTLSYRNVGQAVSIPATYELILEIRNGLPVVVSLDSYAGVPRTALWLERNKAVINLERADTARVAAQAVIRRDDLINAQNAAEADAKLKEATAAAAAAASLPSATAPPPPSKAVPSSGATP